MTVENTNPIQHFTANGATKVFAINFEVEGKDNIKVTVDGTTVSVNDYNYDASVNAVVFNTAPAADLEVIIERVTSLDRSINYQTYNNSFRPETLNYDLDRIWHVLQEDNITDAEILSRIKDEIEWRRTHNTEWDLLAQAREQGLFNALKSYMDTIGAMSVPNLFDGITDNVVITEDGVSQRVTNRDVKQELANLNASLISASNTAKSYTDAETSRAVAVEGDLSNIISIEQARALAAETGLQTQINTVGVGNRAYLTYVAMDADKSNIPAKSKITVTNDTDTAKNGDYQFDGTVFTKSAYDALTQAKAYVDSNANFAPYKIGNVSLNTLVKIGIYFATEVANAILANDYPVNGLTGVIHVAQASNTSLVFQEFRSASGVDYWRSWNGTTWTAWKLKIDLSIYEQTTKSFTDLGLLITDVDLNNLKTAGRWALSDGTTIATTALNYPKAGVSGVLEVLKNSASSVVIQRFSVYNATAPELWIRIYRNSWSAWVKAGSDLITTNTYKIVSVFTASMLADDLRTEAAVYLVNNNTYDLVAAGLPEKSLGLLKISKSTASSFAVQEFVASVSGKSYTRHWNGTVWSAWASYAPSNSTDSSLITFTKTATALQWYLPNSGSGTNKIRHTFNRGINPEINRDSWGMGTASVYSAANGLVQNITTNGVWECAIIDSQNVGDHSGGGHGDEVKFLSYFLIDGVKYDEDFAASFNAKEVKHVQHSTIYVEGQNIPICTRKTTWTFTKDGNNSKTTLEWAAGRTITKARIAMLPVYRKANQDGTGDQITDTEIRSQDDQVINVAEHGFALRDLSISNGDSILLSSALSNVSANVKVKAITAKDPSAYIQNTILYNKVYVNGFKETAEAFVTSANDVWKVETDFTIKIRS